MKVQIASKSAKKIFDVSSLIDGELTYTTERVGVASKLEFNLIKNADISYLEGDPVYFQADRMNFDMSQDPLVDIKANSFEAFKGHVLKKVKSQESIKTTCYDQFFRLRQCKQSYNIKDMKVREVIKMIANEYGFETGSLAPVDYILPKKIYDNQTLLDIIVDCVNRTNVATGKVYNFFDEFGKLTLKEATDMKLNLIIGNESFANDYTYTTTLENTYNYIKLVQNNQDSGGVDAYIVRDPKSIEDWGLLQYYEKVDDNLNPAQIQERAKLLFNYYNQRRRKLKLTAMGVAEVRAGSMVMIDIPGLGDINLKKVLLVDKCVHRITSGSHTMDLEMEVYNG